MPTLDPQRNDLLPFDTFYTGGVDGTKAGNSAEESALTSAINLGRRLINAKPQAH